MVLGWDNLWQPAVALVAAFLAGAVNAMAGGGTNISFPTLIWLGLPPIQANATSAVALWPGRVSGTWGFHREIATARRWWLWLALPAFAGGALGAYLLVHTPSKFFESIAPFLVLISALLVGIESKISEYLHLGQKEQGSTGWRVLAIVVQLVIAIYGGYFGAGLGMLLLTALGLLGVSNLHQANGLKNFFGIGIKGVAVVYFGFVGTVAWHAALLMVVGAVAGGYAGARLGRKIQERTMRWGIVAIGLGMVTVMFLQQ